MPTEIRMPRLVDTMTQGTVVAWRAQEGERVTAGEVIAEIEVDKTTVDLQAPDAGTLTRIVVPAGSADVEVGSLLAILDPDGGPAPADREDSVSVSSPPAKADGLATQPHESAPMSVRAARADAGSSPDRSRRQPAGPEHGPSGRARPGCSPG